MMSDMSLQKFVVNWINAYFYEVLKVLIDCTPIGGIEGNNIFLIRPTNKIFLYKLLEIIWFIWSYLVKEVLINRFLD